MDTWSDNGEWEGIDVDSLVDADTVLGRPIKVVIVGKN